MQMAAIHPCMHARCTHICMRQAPIYPSMHAYSVHPSMHAYGVHASMHAYRVHPSMHAYGVHLSMHGNGSLPGVLNAVLSSLLFPPSKLVSNFIFIFVNLYFFCVFFVWYRPVRFDNCRTCHSRKYVVHSRLVRRAHARNELKNREKET